MPPVSPNWLSSRTLDILVQSYSDSARTVQVRGFSVSEQITHDHTTNSDRSVASSSFNVNDVPTMLSVTASATGLVRGRCFVKVFLRAEGVIVACLASGYVYDTHPLAFPNGKIEGAHEGRGYMHSVSGGAFSAGQEIGDSVPTGTVWELKSMQFTFVTSAAVANRRVRLLLNIGGVIVSKNTIGTSITASTTNTLNYMQGGISIADTVTPQQDLALPEGLRLPAGSTISTSTTGLDVGDQFTARGYIAEEWIQP